MIVIIGMSLMSSFYRYNQKQANWELFHEVYDYY